MARKATELSPYAGRGRLEYLYPSSRVLYYLNIYPVDIKLGVLTRYALNFSMSLTRVT